MVFQRKWEVHMRRANTVLQFPPKKIEDAWNTSSTDVLSFPSCPCIKSGPKVPTNCITGVGVSCCQVPQSRWLVIKLLAKRRANTRTLSSQRPNSYLLWFPSTVWVQSDLQQNGCLPHSPLRLCHYQPRAWHSYDVARQKSRTRIWGHGRHGSWRSTPGTIDMG